MSEQWVNDWGRRHFYYMCNLPVFDMEACTAIGKQTVYLLAMSFNQDKHKQTRYAFFERAQNVYVQKAGQFLCDRGGLGCFYCSLPLFLSCFYIYYYPYLSFRPCH